MTSFAARDFEFVIKHQNMAGKFKGWSAQQLANVANMGVADNSAMVYLCYEASFFNAAWGNKIGQARVNSYINDISAGNGDWTLGHPVISSIRSFLGNYNPKTYIYPPH